MTGEMLPQVFGELMGRGTNGREMSVNSTNKSVPLRRVFCQLSTLTVVLQDKAPMIIFQSADFGLATV